MGLGRSGGRHSGKGQQCQCPVSRTGSAFKKREKVAETWRVRKKMVEEVSCEVTSGQAQL